jgi:hypothetical protein
MNKWIAALLTASICAGAYFLLPNRSSALEEWNLTSTVPVQAMHTNFAPQHQTGVAAAAAKANSSGIVKDKPVSILDDTVNTWKQTLAKEKGFEAWSNAAWNSYTLGPGNHGWVIILQNAGQEIGYMIIHAAENGDLRLTEYGSGSSPLFSLTTLYQSLMQLELISDSTSFEEFIKQNPLAHNRWYTDAFHAVWKITLNQMTYVLDAKTGEALPVDDSSFNSIGRTPLPDSTSLTGTVDESLVPTFDPYDRLPWVEGTPLPVTGLEELKSVMQKHAQLTYAADLYEGKVTYALAVRGFRQWGKDDPYLILDQKGPRYLLLSFAVDQGKFYH